MHHNIDEIVINHINNCNVYELRKMLFLEELSVDSRINGRPLISLAIKHSDTEMINMLLCFGVDVNATDGYGDTPSHYAVKVDNCFSILYSLFINGANFDLTNDMYQSPLSLVFEDDNFNVSKYLIKLGANPNVTDRLGHSLLCKFIATDNLRYLKLLRDSKIRKDLVINDDGDTLMHCVVNNYRKKGAEIVFGMKGDINAYNNIGETALLLAAMKERTDKQKRIKKLLYKHNALIGAGYPLHAAAIKRNHGVIHFLRECKIDLNKRNKKNQTALDVCFERNDYDMLLSLLSCGVRDANFMRKNSSWLFNNLYLHGDCWREKRLLIECGAIEDEHF